MTRGSMLKNPRNRDSLSGTHNGCSCCNSKQTRRAGKKVVKRQEARAWRRDQGLD